MDSSEDQWKRLQAAGLTTPMGHRILGSLPSRGDHWFRGEQIVNATASPRWIYLWFPESITTEARANPPSLSLASKHLAIQHPSLDRWTFADANAKCLLASCVPIDGIRLEERMRAGLCTWQQSAEMVKQIAGGLKLLHASQLVHGDINLRSIWSKDDKSFTLARDPLFPPIHPLLNAKTLTSDKLTYAAPEFSVPNQVPTVQSDLYSLGCVWLTLSTGKVILPTDATNGLVAWSRYVQRSSLEAMIKSSVPSLLHNTISRLVAPNPDARFANCDQLLAALSSLASPRTSENTTRPSTAVAPTSSPVTPATNVTQSATPSQIATGPTSRGPTSTEPTSTVPKKIPSPADLKSVGPSVATPIAAVPNTATPNTATPNTATPSAATPSAATPSAAATGRTTTGSRTAPASMASLKRKKKKKKPVWLIPAMVFGSVLLFAPLLAFFLNKDSSKQVSSAPATEPAREVVVVPPKEPTIAKPNSVANSQANVDRTSTGINPIAEYYSVVSDDGKSLWAPPSAGTPYSLEMLPAGLEGIVFLSSRAWKQNGEFASLGKWWSEAQPQLASFFSPIPFAKDDRIESVALAVYEGKGSVRARWALRYNLKQATAIPKLTEDLPGWEVQYLDPKANSKQGIWTSESTSPQLAIAFDELGTLGSSVTKRITIGPLDLVSSMLETAGGAAPVRRQMETLLKSTDSKSDITLLFAPSFVFGTTGQKLLADSPSILAWAKEWIDESTSAMAFSTSMGEQFYAELRMVSPDTKDSGKTLASLKDRLRSLPDQLEAAMLASPADPYWRAISNRFPQMLRSLQRYARFGLEDGQIVGNTYLPKEAGSNLAVASWMAIVSPRSNASVPATTATTNPSIKSMDEILSSKISLAFEQESLESALQSIQSEVIESVLKGGKVSMSINGGAFQKEGITQNQQIRSFKQEQMPLRAVLTDLVRRANPVTTVQSATEKNQKVVWLVMDAPEEPTKKKIQLTTRTWAEANGVALPEEFVANN